MVRPKNCGDLFCVRTAKGRAAVRSDLNELIRLFLPRDCTQAQPNQLAAIARKGTSPRQLLLYEYPIEVMTARHDPPTGIQ